MQATNGMQPTCLSHHDLGRGPQSNDWLPADIGPTICTSWQEESHTQLSLYKWDKKGKQWLWWSTIIGYQNQIHKSQPKELMFLQMFFSASLNSERKGQGKNVTFLFWPLLKSSGEFFKNSYLLPALVSSLSTDSGESRSGASQPFLITSSLSRNRRGGKTEGLWLVLRIK